MATAHLPLPHRARQVPGAEHDGKDEALCASDMNIITDDDLKSIFVNLPSSVKFTMIAGEACSPCCPAPPAPCSLLPGDLAQRGPLLGACSSGRRANVAMPPCCLLTWRLPAPPARPRPADCCHSGTLLDQETIVISGPKPGDPPAPKVDIGQLMSLFGMREGGGEEASRDIRSRWAGRLLGRARNVLPRACRASSPPAARRRSLPTNALLEHLSGMLGRDVNPDNFHRGMADVFGRDAPAKVLNIVQVRGAAPGPLAGAAAAAARPLLALDGGIGGCT